MRLIDLTGRRFGRLTVTGRFPGNMYKTQVAWECQCDCGGVLVTIGASLRRGAVNSCGCIRRNDHEYITYEAAHLRIRQRNGLASEHLCVDCAQQAAHWSYDHTDTVEYICTKRYVLYSLDPQRYQPRCAKCHKRHDQDRRASTAQINDAFH